MTIIFGNGYAGSIFSGNKMKLLIQNDNKEVVKYDLQKVDSIFDYSEQIIASAARFI